jgi:hypothetical protein
MEHILQRVTGASRISMIDGFSGYNQISVMPEDREKTTFTTPWGTFMYAKMPFELMNAGATFQRAMDIAFIRERDNFMVIYLDDITVFSKINIDTLVNAFLIWSKDCLGSKTHFTSFPFLSMTVICFTNSAKFELNLLRKLILPRKAWTSFLDLGSDRA